MRIEPPTADELAQYVEALAAGMDPEVARTEIWPSRRWDTMLSLVHPEGHNDPILVGWTTCGECLMHIRNCRCVGGPKEPEYITNWRTTKPRAVSTPVERVLPEDARKLVGPSYLSAVTEVAALHDILSSVPDDETVETEADHG